MIAETPATWNICYAPQPIVWQPRSCVANSPNPSFYAGDLWTCSGPGCQEWLDEAHCLLNEGTATRPPTRLTRMIGEGLIYGSRYRAVGMRIDFTSVDGGENRARLW